MQNIFICFKQSHNFLIPYRKFNKLLNTHTHLAEQGMSSTKLIDTKTTL